MTIEELKKQAEQVATKVLTPDAITVIMLADLIARQDAFIESQQRQILTLLGIPESCGKFSREVHDKFMQG